MRISLEQEEYYRWWWAQKQDADYVPGHGAVISILNDDGTPAAVALYTDYNTANINIHISAEPGKHWCTREFLWYCFRYPFVELGVKRLTGIVASSNAQARKFDENLGFTLEATLKDAHPEGDLLVYKMTKDTCRWLTLKDRKDGNRQTKGPSST